LRPSASHGLTPGIGIDGDTPDAPIILFKEVGKVAALRKHIAEGIAYPLPGAQTNGAAPKVDMSKVFVSQTSMAHTRWATHGVPNPSNCHPHVSDPVSQFSLVHNGIITNYKELKHVLTKRGYSFKTDTDTEAVAVLCQYVYESQPHKRLNFTELIKTVVKELAS
jgi:glucosamine--fructose-6-phosphate aminotransferase (isomerizing)